MVTLYFLCSQLYIWWWYTIGKVLEVAGEESSGKSLIAYNFAYTCQQLGGHVIWVDAEQSWMNSWAEANGVDPEKLRY